MIAVLVALVLARTTADSSSRPVHSSHREVPAVAPETVRVGRFRVEQLDFGAPHLGANVLHATAVNEEERPFAVVLEVRAYAGQWSPAVTADTVRIILAPHERRDISAPYRFARFTVEASLRVSIFLLEPMQQTLQDENLVFRRWYDVGAHSPSAVDLGTGMVRRQTPHLDLFAPAGSVAASNLSAVAAARERAIAQIADLLNVSFEGRIRLVLYPDSASKTRATGHVGMGMASGRDIVEIFAESIHVDPFHEITHIVASALGTPPSMIDEGFATYMSERLGADALEFLGNRRRRIATVACELVGRPSSVGIVALLHLDDISNGEGAGAAYAESAAFVKFLIEVYGVERFRRAFAALSARSDPASLLANDRVLQQIYGESVSELESHWRRWVCEAAR